MRSVLLTGGSGFFGKSVLDALRRGVLDSFGIDRIVIVARRAHRLRAEAPELCGHRVDLVDSDVLCLQSTFDADVVIHAAATANLAQYEACPAEATRLVEQGARHLWELAAGARRRPRMLLVSSGAVYGRQPNEVAALTEDAVAGAHASPAKQAYAEAKRRAEAAVVDVAGQSGLPTRIARCFAFIGPWLPLDSGFAVGQFLRSALRCEPIRVHSVHPVVRTYMHADDLALWLLTLATADGSGYGDAYNVGSAEKISIRDLAAVVASSAGVDVMLPDDGIAGDGGQGGVADRYVPDVSKARRDFGLGLTIPLRQAIESTLRALRASPRWRTNARGDSAGVAPTRAAAGAGD